MGTLPRNLSTGVDIIDSEHEYLIDWLDQLKLICDREKESCLTCDDSLPSQRDTTLDEMLTELLAYMVEHFRREENLMIGLPEWIREQHIIEHANIAERISQLLNEGSKNKDMIVSPMAMQNIITHWLEDHIRHWDIPVAICLGAKPG